MRTGTIGNISGMGTRADKFEHETKRALSISISMLCGRNPAKKEEATVVERETPALRCEGRRRR